MKAIVLVDEDWGIGKDGEQIIYIPGDLKYFRETTMGYPVILGRKTLATFPGGCPLKGRRNLILSRNLDFAPDGAEVFPDLETLLAEAPKDSFVIGGASVYEALLEYCDVAYVTRIHKVFPADCRFPNLDQNPEWKIIEEGETQKENNIEFHRVIYRRK